MQPAQRLPRRDARERLGRLWSRFRGWGHLVGRAFWRGSLEFYGSDDLTHAASVAYYALLSIFPFFLLAFSILGSVTGDEERRVATIGFLLKYFPTQFDFLTRQLDALRQTRVQLGIGGAIAMTWAALGFFSAISSAVNHAWGVEKQRSYVKHKLVSFLMLLAAGLLLALALLLGSALQIVDATWYPAAVARVPALAVLQSLALRWATTILFIVVVGLVYYFVPNAKVHFWDVWPGAVVTGLLWRGTLEGFSYYVRDMNRFTLVHGSIAAVVVFLIWVYACAVVLLYGVEFTAAYARLRRGRSEQVPAAPSPRT
ncbi:MAG: YihY/virulence factor BrkB family protein [Acidobacteria bacterium]|nr:MAG: YihY/virulence factor BrkB family protein [Acidobacteriota bacterium]